MSNERILKEFPLSHKIEEWSEGKTDDRDIRPILMLGEDDRRPAIGKRLHPLDLKVIEDREDAVGNFPGNLVDYATPSHPEPRIVKCQNRKFKSMSNFKY